MPRELFEISNFAVAVFLRSLWILVIQNWSHIKVRIMVSWEWRCRKPVRARAAWRRIVRGRDASRQRRSRRRAARTDILNSRELSYFTNHDASLAATIYLVCTPNFEECCNPLSIYFFWSASFSRKNSIFNGENIKRVNIKSTVLTPLAMLRYLKQ